MDLAVADAALNLDVATLAPAITPGEMQPRIRHTRIHETSWHRSLGRDQDDDSMYTTAACMHHALMQPVLLLWHRSTSAAGAELPCLSG